MLLSPFQEDCSTSGSTNNDLAVIVAACSDCTEARRLQTATSNSWQPGRPAMWVRRPSVEVQLEQGSATAVLFFF